MKNPDTHRASALPSCVRVIKGVVEKAVRATAPEDTTKKAHLAQFMERLDEVGALRKKETAGQMVRCKKEVQGE